MQKSPTKMIPTPGAESAPAAPEGRRAKKQRATRARLLRAAYEIMSTGGIDGARIKDIADHADIGFGTFYNYFDDKDAVAGQVLDCLIHDIGERIRSATRHLRAIDMALVVGVSTRLALRAAMADPIWQWWALRPDLLFDRISKGFGPFAMSDVRLAIEAGDSCLSESQVEPAWALAAWAMVGGIHDVVVGDRDPESEAFVAESIMRLMGATNENALRATTTGLPICGPAEIDWDFVLPDSTA
jgi:AcrR family transcriptional regulator